jgi:spermidine synthase
MSSPARDGELVEVEEARTTTAPKNGGSSHHHASTHGGIVAAAATTNGRAAGGGGGIADQRAKAACTFRESLLPGVDIVVDLRRILFSHTSPYQQIDIIETTYGKTLVTDGKTQSAAFDEYVYHESLVHSAMLSMLDNASATNQDDDESSKRLKTVFIGGGGELATAREVLRYHEQLAKVVMVDLDVTVIDACRTHLPEWGGASVYDHPKFQLVIGDAYQYLMDDTKTETIFDVIIMDISDPIESGPGNLLYTQEFYQHVAQHKLHPRHGVFVTQAGMAESVPSAPFMPDQDDPSCHAPIYNTLRSVFSTVQLYTTNIPSFGSDWGFVLASNHHHHHDMLNVFGHHTNDIPRRIVNGINDDDATSTIPTQMNGCDDTRTTTATMNGSGALLPSTTTITTSVIQMIDERIERHIDGGAAVLKHYDGLAHQKMFALTKPLRTHLDQDDRIITVDRPIYMY